MVAAASAARMGMEAAGPIREASEDRIQYDLDQARPEEDRSDRERAPAGVVEGERGQDDEQPEEHRGEHVQPETADEPLVT